MWQLACPVDLRRFHSSLDTARCPEALAQLFHLLEIYRPVAISPSVGNPCLLHLTAASPAAVTTPVAHILQRVGCVWGSGLARGRLGAPSERQDDEQRGKPSLPVHQFLPVAYHGEKFAATVPYGRSTLN